jgi:hypothetical protein
VDHTGSRKRQRDQKCEDQVSFYRACHLACYEHGN